MTVGRCGRWRRVPDLDPEQQRVLVAIDEDVADPLALARGLALAPQAIARPAPVMGKAGGEGLLECCLVHPGGHKALAGRGVDDEDRDEPVIEARRNALPSSIGDGVSKSGHREGYREKPLDGLRTSSMKRAWRCGSVLNSPVN